MLGAKALVAKLRDTYGPGWVMDVANTLEAQLAVVDAARERKRTKQLSEAIGIDRAETIKRFAAHYWAENKEDQALEALDNPNET